MAIQISNTIEPFENTVNDASFSKTFADLTESVGQFINDCYILNLLCNRSSVYNKLEYLVERYPAKFSDSNDYYEVTRRMDSLISKMISSGSNIKLSTSELDPNNEILIKSINEHHISFTTKMKAYRDRAADNDDTLTNLILGERKAYIDRAPTDNDDTLTNLIVAEIKKGKLTALKNIENDMPTKQTNTQYFLSISTMMNYMLSAFSQSLANYYILIFMRYNTTIARTLSESSLIGVITAEKPRIYRQAEYFDKTRSMLKYHLCSLSFTYGWQQKLENALTWYFVFSIIHPLLSSSHPIHHYIYQYAYEFVAFHLTQTAEADLLSDWKVPNEIQQLLDKINDYETNRLLYSINGITDQTHQNTNFDDIGFTFEFSASAAALIAQNRSTELFDLYRISIGTFGGGLTSSVSTLMENSFDDVKKLIEPTGKSIESFYLARADLRSKIDDWNGVYDDLQKLRNTDVAKSYCYKELSAKYEQASNNRASILNEQKRIEYLLIRSTLCTSLGEFQDAFTALLDANYLVNVMKSVSPENVCTTEKEAASRDDKIWSEFQSCIEASNKYLQEHLRFSIERSSEPKIDPLYSQHLGDHFQKLNILIGTLSILYDKASHEFAFDHYIKALPAQVNYKYFHPLNENEFSNMLASFKKFLETLKELTKQEPFTLDEKVFSDFVENIITFDKYDETGEQSNLFVEQYYQILNLNTHIRSLSNLSNQGTTGIQQQTNESSNNNSGVDISEERPSSSDETDASRSVTEGSSTEASSNTTRRNYYNILSLDGGGIRGIYQAIILMEIKRRTKRPIHDLFHCFAGTSTGGILACGLAKKQPKTAEELLSLYLGPRRFEIFKSNRPKTFYSSEGLESILHKELGNQHLSDCDNKDLIIPVEIQDQGRALFINRKSPSTPNGGLFEENGLWFFDIRNDDIHFTYRHPDDTLLKNVVRCTSAASPYFRPKKLVISRTHYTFYDGGYRHNQPDVIALKWARNKRSFRKEDIFLLSIGNTTTASKPLKNIGNLFRFLLNCISTAESMAEKYEGMVCKSELEQSYRRIIPKLNKSPAMDNIDPVNLQLLWEAAWETIREKDRLGEFDEICQMLLERSVPDTSFEANNRPPIEVTSYASRSMREPDLYRPINSLFIPNDGINIPDDQLSKKLENLFQKFSRYKNDQLRCAECCRTTPTHACILSMAAAIGHVESIKHYFQPRRKVQRSNEEPRCSSWKPLHYAAANGEILAALYILFKGVKPIDVANVSDTEQLKEMRQVLDEKTKDSTPRTPLQLAEKFQHDLTEKSLKKVLDDINFRLGPI